VRSLLQVYKDFVADPDLVMERLERFDDIYQLFDRDILLYNVSSSQFIVHAFVMT
jgi:hypothetical protein